MTIDRRYSVSEGTAVKAPCRAATTANITLSGEQTIDGIAVVEHDRVLVKNQSTGSQNGIYDVSTGNWTRARDFDGAFDIVTGTRIFVNSGTVNALFEYAVSTTGTITIDTTSIAFAPLGQVSANAAATASAASATASASSASAAAASAATAAGFNWSTGDVKLTLKTTADSGWRLFDDGTIGDASSGATYANVLAVDLFTLLYNNLSDTAAPVFTSSGVLATRAGQGLASTAWAAHDRMSLPKTLGRALAIAGSGSGLTARTLGQTAGSETSTLLTANLPAYTPAGTITNGAITNNVSGGIGGSDGSLSGAGTGATSALNGYTAIAVASSQVASTFSGTAQGGTSAPVSIVQPEIFLNAMVKL